MTSTLTSPAATTGRVATATVDSPIGSLRLTARAGMLSELEMLREPSRPTPAGDVPAALRDTVDQVAAYFAGELTEFSVPLALDGTPFQRQVWAGLLAIPYGQTWSYGELAARVGRPTAYRAVGLAVGRNPVAVIVPCHRVIGANGSLTGFGGGLERKATLLQLERRVSAARGR
jgi:methylated-DNA-[protein]-cysteine S-methyltransferase